MSQTPEHSAEKTESVEKKRPLWRRVLKWFDRILGAIIIVLALALLFIQTSCFRDLVISEVRSLVENETNGTISIGSIDGNFLSGFTLNEVHLRLKNSSDTSDILHAKELYVRYSIFKLIAGKGLPFKDIVLRSPDINLTRKQGDSIWNYQKLIKPSAPSAPDTSKFSMKIDLGSFRIENGSLRVKDENDSSSPPPAIVKDLFPVRWSDLDVQGLDLDITAHIDGSTKQQIAIRHLGLQEKKSRFHLYHAELQVDRDGASAKIKELQIVTARSSIRLDAEVDPLVILEGHPYDSLGRSVTKLALDARSISTEELRQFLPVLSFLGGTPSIILNAKGEYGKLVIEKGNLDLHSEGEISFKGSIFNLHKPADLAFNIDLEGSNLSQRSVAAYLPGIPLTDLARYGRLDIRSLHYEGTPLNFVSNFDLVSTIGNIKGKASLDLRRALPVYDLDITSENVNFSPLIGDTMFTTKASLAIKAHGSGFDLKHGHSEFSVLATAPFNFEGANITGFSTKGRLDSAVLTVSETNIHFLRGASITSDYAILDFNGPKLRYEALVKASRIPAAEFVHKLPDSTRVTLSANISGEGTSLDALEGSLQSSISGLQFQKNPIPDMHLNGVFERNPDGTRSDRIESDIADITLTGKYTLEKLGKELSLHLDALSNAAREQHHVADSLRTGIISRADSLEIIYAVHLKDLRPLDVFFSNLTVLGEGRVRGIIKESPDGKMDFDATGKINRFLIKPFGTDSLRKTAGLDLRVFDTTNFTFDLTNWGMDDRTLLDSLQAAISLHADSSIRINGLMIERPDISIIAANRELSYKASSEISDMVRFYLGGKGQYLSDKLVLPVDTLALDFGNKFVWQTEHPFIVSIDTSGLIAMDTLALYRPELGYDPNRLLAQRIKISFALMGDSLRYAFVRAPLLKLKEIPLFFSRGKPEEQYSTLGGNITNLSLDAYGNLADPSMRTTLRIKNFNFNDVTFDTCSANLSLEHRTLTGQSKFHVDTAKFTIQNRRAGNEVLALPFNNSFFVSVDSFPVHLKFAGKEETEAQKKAFRERTFTIRAEGKDYPLDMFSPFLPLVSDAHGLFNAKMTLFGTTDSIHLRGNMDIQRSSVLMSTTNVPYYLSGPITLTESQMRFDSVVVENFASDDKDGKALLWGYMNFNGLTPGNFDFTMQTNRLTVMTENTKDVMPTIYGPLAIQTGDRPLHFFGTLEVPHISGDIIIPQANLTLPQNTVGGDEGGSHEITYRTLDSITHVAEDTTAKMEEFVAPLSLYDKEDTATSLKAAQNASRETLPSLRGAHETKDLSFTDRLLYDTLRINIPGDVWLNIYFNKAKGLFGDQLTAELRSEGDLKLNRSRPGAPLQFNGVLTVTDRSSYTFLKAFSPVYGTITFLNEISNPILNITAEYIGTDASPDVKTGDYREYKVVLKITGNASEPQLAMEMYQKNIATGRFEKMDEPEDIVKNDVLSFLATGTVMSQTGATNSQEISQSLGNSLSSQAYNTAISYVLGQTALKSYIRSASVEVGEKETKLKLTAGYKDITFQYGSQSLSDPLAADYMVEIPASMFMKFKNARNLRLQVEAHNYSLGNGSSNSVIIQPNFAGSVYYRFFLPPHSLFH